MATKPAYRFAIFAFAFVAATALAKPYLPTDDATVLERLPEKIDPSLAELKRQRTALARSPGDAALAAALARRAIEAARETGDPRFLGQAQAALAPWWKALEVPAPILVLRATVKQSQHDFPGALADLDQLLKARPGDGQALLTRATVLTVQGRYDEAKRDCARLTRVAAEIVTTACLASPASLSGNADSAYRGVVQALARTAGADAGVVAWVSTLAAEIAARRGDTMASDAHFRTALAADPRDAYTRGAYADFLLDGGRPAEVVTMLADETRNDALLLRLALAEARIPEMKAAFDTHRADLAARFDASRQRGDTVHRREEARFRLDLEHDASGALALARANWEVQREPADLRILAESARGAGDAATLRIASDWIAVHRLEDRRVVALTGAQP